MEQLAARVLDVAGRQVQILAAALDSTQVPRTLNPDGSLRTSDYKWWCSGFFPGTLWYVYAYTGDSRFYDLAVAECAKIDGVQYITDGHDVGFMANCSFGNCLRIGGIEEYARPLANAAHNLAARFNPTVGCTLSWNPRKDKDWLFPVIIDNMMNLELLMDYGDRTLAVAHAFNTAWNHFREDGTVYHLVDFSDDGSPLGKQTVQGYSDDSAWARGQAWALYGYAMMAQEETQNQDMRETFYGVAAKLESWLLANLPEDGIPYWDFSQSDYKDASAGAIIACGLLKMWRLRDCPADDPALTMAERILRTLASPEYLAEPRTNGGFLLKHGVGNLPGHSEVDVPLTYADYYFLEALTLFPVSATSLNNN